MNTPKSYLLLLALLWCCSPDKPAYMQHFNQEYSSADRLRYAKIELLTYGW